MTSSESAAAPLGHAEIRTILVGVMLAMFLGALDQTIVATALPTIGRELNDVQSLSWVVTAYLLTSTAVTPLYGKLSDVHGRRTMLLAAIILFLAGSIACALSRNIHWLIVARAAQGLGGGGLISLAQTIIGDIIPPRERGRYQAYFASVFVTSSIAGPVLGGFLAEHLHWSFIFWINLPLAVAAYLMTNEVLKRLPRHDRPHRIDVAGALLMVVATVALLLALTWGGTSYHWGSPQILGLLAVSLLGWIAFAARLATAPEPFIPLSILANAVVRNGVLATFFAVGVMVGLSIYVPIYFEAVMGLSASESGLALIALMGGVVAGATAAGRMMMRMEHYKTPPAVGLGIAALLTFIPGIWPSGLSLLVFELLMVGVGLGIGTLFPITTTGIQNAVPPYQIGTATGLLNFFRSLGSALLVAGLGAIFLIGASSGSDLASVQAIVTEGAAAGVDFGPVFRGVFIASGIALVLAFFFLLRMEELPLRGHGHPPPDLGH